MVFVDVSIDADQFEDLRDALEKLKLNDAALQYEPETSSAMGLPAVVLGCCTWKLCRNDWSESTTWI